ncbi:IS4 family transposase [Streptomyces sp. HPF1205]|uniref:IS4 family transposase n=1 Tax=Streptomyces sp. HPF1205 TaxID=2873262 RepID=UPI001CEDAC9D|nr:IS4 family transposase [Streptomyces sp. HPF1205]
MARDHIAGDSFPERVRMGLLTRTFTPELVYQAVEETGAWEERTKALPSTLMVYFTLVMWLFTGHGYGGVLRELLENVPRRAGEKWTRPARTGSVTKARARLGAAPLRWLFGQVAGVQGTPATPGVFWRGLRVVALDGTLFDLPASDANTACFGSSSNGEQQAGYPQARMVALGECGTHAVVGAVFGPFATGERTLAHRLLPHLTAGMLLLADRGFPSFGLWEKAAATGAELLWRASDSFTLPVVEALPDGTYLSRLREQRTKRTIDVRVIEYTITRSDEHGEVTSELFCLITTLLDAQAAPAAELAELYARRWTSETIYRHIKIEQRGGRTATLRSNSPVMVEQELWAMLCVYQATRQLITDTAHEHQLPPGHISFKNALNAARRTVGADFSPSPPGRQDP